MIISNPNPRIDEEGVPWCDSKCTHCEVDSDGCNCCQIIKLKYLSPNRIGLLCLPHIRKNAKEIIDQKKIIDKQ